MDTMGRIKHSLEEFTRLFGNLARILLQFTRWDYQFLERFGLITASSSVADIRHLVGKFRKNLRT